MNSLVQSWAQVLTIAAAIVGALIYQTHYIDKRFDDLKDWIRAELRRIDERLDRIEHPLIRQ
jgi:hypothetical protein